MKINNLGYDYFRLIAKTSPVEFVSKQTVHNYHVFSGWLLFILDHDVRQLYIFVPYSICYRFKVLRPYYSKQGVMLV
jgi:hypothetical protein